MITYLLCAGTVTPVSVVGSIVGASSDIIAV
jgi:hypothetical protein